MTEKKEEKNENKEESDKGKKVTLGSSISLTSSVTIIVTRGDARKELDKLPGPIRQQVLDEAIKISKSEGNAYDITLERVLEAKRRLNVP